MMHQRAEKSGGADCCDPDPKAVVDADDPVHARDLFAAVLNAATEQSIVAMDRQGLITVFNAGAEKMLGYSAAEIVGLHTPPILHDPVELAERAALMGIEADFRVIIGRAAHGEPETRQWTYLTKAGRRLQAMITTTAMRGSDGEINGYIKVGTDITARLAAEEALEVSDALFADVFNNAPIGIMLLDITTESIGHILRVNPAICRITGHTQEQLLTMSAQDLTHPDHTEEIRANADALSSGSSTLHEAERRWIHAAGHDIWVQVSATPVRNDQTRVVLVLVEDITARREAEQRLTHLALHDALTGLPNRALLFDRLGHALAASTRGMTHVALFYLDLDGFKAVNDDAGHLAGDELLRSVADRLSSHVRPGDTVSRLGGDEFVVICPELSEDSHAQTLGTRLLNVFARPYTVGSTVHNLSASIGVAVSDRDSTAAGLLRNADDAMYVAKGGGKNRVHRSTGPHQRGLTRTSRGARQAKIEAQFSLALDRDELLMHAQPIIDLLSGRIIAVETLVRWQHPTRGLLPPAEFLDVAESSPLMIRIGQRILDESCRIGARLSVPSGADHTGPCVFVNVSGRQLESGNLRDDVAHALTTSGLHPSQLVLELTETFMPLIAGSLMEDLESLRREGVRLAIDDLGTGYSSLSRLTELPVDILKIDRSFTARIGTNTSGDAVVRAIFSIAQSLQLQVVAEGVETKAEEEQLRQLGCRTAQGFLYSRPLAEDDLSHLLAAGPGPT